jgi:hypothetical protein
LIKKFEVCSEPSFLQLLNGFNHICVTLDAHRSHARCDDTRTFYFLRGGLVHAFVVQHSHPPNPRRVKTHLFPGDDCCIVGALCKGRAIQRKSIWCASLSCLSRSSNQTNEIDEGDQMNQIPATRLETLEC